MSMTLTRERIAGKAIVHAELPAAQVSHQVDRSFELPTTLYVGTVGMFLAYLVIMGFGFAHPELMLPLAIFAVAIVAGFGVPALWVRMRPENPTRPKSWSRFMAEGVQTPSGLCKGRDATVQVLIMPTLVLLWGMATVTIAALVR